MNRLLPQHYELAKNRMMAHRRQASVLGGARQAAAEKEPRFHIPGTGGEVWNEPPGDVGEV